MRASPDDELLAILAETNDLRRDVGRALLALHRACLLWRGRGKPLLSVVRGWARGAVHSFERAEARLRRLSPHRHDAALRSWLAPVAAEIAVDVAGGDSRWPPLIRTLEVRLGELTAMMRAKGRTEPLHDVELARDFRRALSASAADGGVAAARALADLALDVARSTPGPPGSLTPHPG